MLEAPAIGSHSHLGSQTLGEVRHRFVDKFLWQLFPDGVQGGFQLISRLRLFAGVYDTFPAWHPDIVVQMCSPVG